jgi:polyketide-type polyunsaturated fatty acid synthase PfaA
MSVRTQVDGIAIVGIGALFPSALSPADFWRNILGAREVMRDVPTGYWLAEDFYDPDPRVPDKVYCKRGAFLDPVDFDPMKYGVPPKLLTSTDTCQLLSLMVADQVLRDCFGGRFAHVSRDRVGCVLGVCSGLELVGEMAGRLQRPAFVKTLRERGLPEDEVQAISDAIVSLGPEWNESTFPGLLNNVVTGRIANHFDLGGPNFTTDAACASSFAAVAMAAYMLRQGDADLVITGGADTTNDPFTFMCFSKTPALSMSSTCRPFSESSDGTMLGEGLGMFALKRLAEAERDGDRIYAVIRGCGSSSDGRAKSIYAPRWEGQVKSLRRCYDEAGYGPETVELVEAHGTGTKAGDLAEFNALREVFNATGRQDRQWAALGSIKSQLGHTKAAAGAAGLMKTVLALHDKVLPPTFGIDKPAVKLEIEKTPFYLNTTPRPWIREGDHPRRAAVSSFGFGGTNFHLTVEEYTGKRERALRLRSLPTELVVLSGDDRAAVITSARELAAACGRPGVLAHLARESQQRFVASAKARLAVVAAGEADLKSRLEQAIQSLETNTGPAFAVPGAIFFSEQAADGAVAFVFSGQGSQYVSMGADLAAVFDAARSVWDEEAGEKVGQVALHEKVFPRPVFTDADREAAEKALRATEWAQPAIGAVSASQLALLEAIGLKPDCVAGHSFGEVSALLAAGALDRASFLRVARRRGEQMAHAATAGGESGGMTAVTAPIEQVESILGEYASQVVVANHNDPRQVVVSGATPALEEAERRFSAAGLKVQRLPVAAAFHSPVVAGSVAPFAQALEGIAFQAPSLLVFSNATAEPYPAGADAVRELLASSIAKRVRFVEVIEAMYRRGVRTFVEVGPGSVLSGMIGRICGDRPHRAIPLDRPGKHGVTSLWLSLAQLAVAGHAIELSALWREFDLGPDPRTQPKPKMTVRISGTNYGKKYPPEGGAAGLPRPNPPRAQVAKRSNGEVMETKEPKSSAPPESTDGRSKPAAAAMPRAPVPPRANGGRPHADSGNGSVTNGSAKAPAHAEPASNGAPLVTRGHQPGWRQGDVAAWLSAYEAIQCRTAEAHALYQQTMAQCHLAFLRAAEQSAMALASMAVGAPNLGVPAPRGMALPSSAAEEHEGLPMALPPIQWSPPAHAPAPVPPIARPTPPRAPTPVIVSDGGLAVVPSPTAVVRAPSPPASVPAAALEALTGPSPVRVESELPSSSPANPPSALVLPADGDVKTFLFNVISEKTGYPVEILNLDQQLEADLGIDSIKRVEILSAFEGQIPDIKDVNLEEVASLSTLRDVVGFMEKFSDQLGLAKKKE